MHPEVGQSKWAPENVTECNTSGAVDQANDITFSESSLRQREEAGAPILSDAFVDAMLDEVNATYNALSPCAKKSLQVSVEMVDHEYRSGLFE